jgi:predicted amidohydrolase YtcJ
MAADFVSSDVNAAGWQESSPATWQSERVGPENASILWPSRDLLAAGFSFALTVSPVTTLDGYAFDTDRNAPTTATAPNLSERHAVGRIVSRREALRLARKALFQAERERQELVVQEALLGLQWGGNL